MRANTGPSLDTLTQAPVFLCLSSSQPLLPGAERQVQALLSKYGPGKLYQVTSNLSGAGTLDLTLLRGQIVALLQNKDTKGNSTRWLVDTGGTWDFLDSSPPSGKATSGATWAPSCALAVQIQDGMSTGKCRAKGTASLVWGMKCQKEELSLSLQHPL